MSLRFRLTGALLSVGLALGAAVTAPAPAMAAASAAAAAGSAQDTGTLTTPPGAPGCPASAKNSSATASCGTAAPASAAQTAPAGPPTISLPAGAAACAPVSGKQDSSAQAACGTQTGSGGAGGESSVSLPAGQAACASTAQKPSSASASCAHASGGGAAPVAATSSAYSVSLSASPTAIGPGGSSTLTAYSSVDVGPTPYWIEIFDRSNGQNIAVCGTGTSCSMSVSQSSPTTHSFIAYISGYGLSNPPPSVQATSNSVSVTWLSISLIASAYYVAVGRSVRLTATANTDVGPTPWFIEIFDQTTGRFLVDCATGSTCSVSVSLSQSFAEAYSAYVSGYGTSNPPPSVQAHLNSFVTVDWVTVGLSETSTEGIEAAYPGYSATLLATASLNVGPTPYWITIFDQGSGASVAICATGYTCSVTITHTSETSRTYVAYISGSGTSNPPPSVVTTSNTVQETWANYVPGGWIAGKSTSPTDETDPVNLVVYKPSGGAREAFTNNLTVFSPEAWYTNTCYDTSVKFYSGHDPNPANWVFRSPDGSYATDVSTADDPPFVTGCGSNAHERNHLRYWVSSDDTVVWIAVSYEYRCVPVHCLSGDAFNRGRNDLAGDLYNAFSSTYGQHFYETYPQAYDAGFLGSPAIDFDGFVPVFTLLPTVYNSASSEHASWVSDSYDGAPLASIALRSGGVSDNIYVTFSNQGPGNWDTSTVLAYWVGGTDDGQPGNGLEWCHAPVTEGGGDWWTCNPGVSAWIGSGRIIQPGQNGTFSFQIQAPQTGSTISTTLYFRPAQRLSNGTYAWINTTAGHRTYDYFTVLVNP
jgi:hypothetical protein